jgi:ATP-dependent exoDNAse (exonuclease V) beta subunit
VSAAPQAPVADEEQRRAAIAERERNVLIDAGAGTGKTTILVRRLVSLIAPDDDQRHALSIRRVAAITFTRRAAGELRLRIRERLLETLAERDLSETRRTRLHEALAGLDTAHVGTIHSFADRLLRLRPIEADLSPSYEIVEDEEELVRETFAQLLHGAETGTLGDLLAGSPAQARAAETADIVLSALASGIDAESKEREYDTLWGLDGLVAAFVRHRDVPPPDAPAADLDLEEFRRYARELVSLTATLTGDSLGVASFRKFARCLEDACRETDAATVYRQVVGREPKKSGVTMAYFDRDPDAWRAWKAFNGDTTKHPVRATPLRDDLLKPLYRWMGTRLVRMFPVVVELYERAKRRHRAVDQIDLLVKLRDLLAKDPSSRGFYQGLFDHVFVDEFQDTDPLQAEIVLYLCEREPRARNWNEVELAAGKLTVVGDPKQSIYRFRRADVAMYDDVRKTVAAGPHLSVRLSVNFRSARSLIGWFNDRFESLLGSAPEPGVLFHAETGQAFHQPLDAHRDDDGAPRVHVVPFERSDDTTVGPYRALEAQVLARYLRWLVEARRFRILDPTTAELREVGYGDVAVLAISTPALGPLFRELDRAGVPYGARGGTLFLDDPLHKQFLLGLRAIADRDDGIAQAALLRPPFFALDLADLVWERAAGEGGGGAEVERAREAMAIVRDLRRRRLQRSPGATARDLLERTAFARSVARGPNGPQRLTRLRELCLLLEQEAAARGLDYDGVTARLREWVARPVQLDPPRPVGASAVQIMTVHQAKGLEFPVVVLWDSMCELATRESQAQSPWRVGRDGRAWLIALAKLKWEEPPGGELSKREKRYADMERRRVVYVAATRARDLLVVPKATAAGPKHVAGALLAGCPANLVEELPIYVLGRGAPWASDNAPDESSREVQVWPQLEQEIGPRWAAAAREAALPLFLPVPVSGAWQRLSEDDETIVPLPKRAGRYGALFGETVHAAIGRGLAGNSPLDAVRLVAGRTGLTEHLDAAAADVERALAVLQREGLSEAPGPRLRLEYPLAAPDGKGSLLIGYADLVAVRDGRALILDFKTDRPPHGAVENTHPDYVAQLRAYASLLRAGGGGATGEIRCGLLFTADGTIRWVSP